jgi:hypothetical protein
MGWMVGRPIILKPRISRDFVPMASLKTNRARLTRFLKDRLEPGKCFNAVGGHQTDARTNCRLVLAPP